MGHRMKLSQTRAIIDAIHDGSLLKADYITTPVFGLQAPTSCNNVPADVLQPEKQVRTYLWKQGLSATVPQCHSAKRRTVCPGARSGRT